MALWEKVIMKPIYVQIIQQYLDKKKEQNPNYSLRALAARLEIAPSVLSEVLSQKRRLPVKKIDSVIEKLNLTEQEEKAFRYSIKKASTNLRQLAKMLFLSGQTQPRLFSSVYPWKSEWRNLFRGKIYENDAKSNFCKNLNFLLDQDRFQAKSVNFKVKLIRYWYDLGLSSGILSYD